MLVKDIATSNVISVSKDTPIISALEIMERENIRRLLVDKEGIITIRDIVYNWKRISSGTVVDIMNNNLLFISPSANLKEAMRIMTKEAVGSLILGDGENVKGIVTERDLIRYAKVEVNTFIGDIMNVE
ncbi:CBS domain-containing protein, partial [Acidianus sp. RZ1]